MRYRIVEWVCQYKLTEEVNSLLALGWKPQGGISAVCSSVNQTKYVQAMVKED